jgi:hypothetical protein
MWHSELGPVFGNETVPIFLYAEDIFLLAETAEGLQVLINDVIDFCESSGFTSNESKSEFIIFEGSKTKSKKTVPIGSSVLENRDFIRYL